MLPTLSSNVGVAVGKVNLLRLWLSPELCPKMELSRMLQNDVTRPSMFHSFLESDPTNKSKTLTLAAQ